MWCDAVAYAICWTRLGATSEPSPVRPVSRAKQPRRLEVVPGRVTQDAAGAADRKDVRYSFGLTGVTTMGEHVYEVTHDGARLQAMVDVARMITDGVTRADRVAETVVQAATLVADAAAVWVQPIDNPRLRRMAAVHRDPAMTPVLQQGDASHDPYGGDGLVEAVIATGTPAVLDAADVHNYADSLDVMLGGAISAAVVLPLRSKGSASGALVVGRDDGRERFTTEELDFLEALAEMAAITLSTVRVLHGSVLAVEEMRQQAELVDHVSDAVVAWDNHCRVITWNVAAENVYAYSVAEALGCDVHGLLDTRFIGPDGETWTYGEIAAELSSAGVWRGELRQRRADGAEVELLCSLTALPGYPDTGLPAAVAVSQDVTKQRSEERQALNDPLTGLPNRRYLLRHLTDVINQASCTDEVVGVLFLDLDGFKKVNDVMGHDAGDEVLRVVAARLAGALRRDDVVARLGGDEFVVVCRSVTDRTEALKVGRRLMAEAGQPIPIAGQDAVVTPSIGIVVLDGGPGDADADRTPTTILRRADAAMYAAKRDKRGPVIAD